MRNLFKYVTFSVFLFLFIPFMAEDFSLKTGVSGSEQCRQVYSILQKNHFSPYTQSLVVNGENDFPYNIIIDFPSALKENNPNTLEKKNTYGIKRAIFIFNLEDFSENKNLILQTLDSIKSSSFDFDIQIAFLYQNEEINSQSLFECYNLQNTSGLVTFIDQLDTSFEQFAIFVNFGEEKYSIKASSGTFCSPSFFVAGFMNLLKKNAKNADLPYIFISKLFSSNVTYNRQMALFFEEGINCIKLNLGNKENSNLLILQGALKLLKEGKNEIQDQHFLIIKVFGTYVRISEVLIMILLELIIFLCLLYIFIFIFINGQKKKLAWSSVKYVWYVVPVSFLICLLSFFLGRNFSNLLPFIKDRVGINYANFVVQISFSVLLSTLFYLITLLYNPYFHIKAIDYLIVLSCFINQSIFILVDISFFPLFLIIFMLSVICIIIKNNVIHIVLLFLMIFQFIPLAHTTMNFSDPEILRDLLSKKIFSLIMLSLTLYPLLLVYFRILAGIIRKQNSAKSTIITGMSFTLFLLIALSLTAIIRTKTVKERNASPQRQILETTENLIDFEYSDSLVFDDIVRTITITFTQTPYATDVILESENQLPILYTDNDYTTIDKNSIYFKIPQNPPNKLQFSYGCKKENSVITINAYFASPKENCYNFARREIHIGQ